MRDCRALRKRKRQDWTAADDGKETMAKEVGLGEKTANITTGIPPGKRLPVSRYAMARNTALGKAIYEKAEQTRKNRRAGDQGQEKSLHRTQSRGRGKDQVGA